MPQGVRSRDEHAGPSRESPPAGKALKITLWVVQVLLAAFFLLAGHNHGIKPLSEAAKVAPWISGTSPGLVRFIGFAELAGAVGIVLPAATRIAPSLTPLAALGLGTIMALAIPFHVMRGESKVIGLHIIVVALAIFVAWGRFRRAPILPRKWCCGHTDRAAASPTFVRSPFSSTQPTALRTVRAMDHYNLISSRTFPACFVAVAIVGCGGHGVAANQVALSAQCSDPGAIPSGAWQCPDPRTVECGTLDAEVLYVPNAAPSCQGKTLEISTPGGFGVGTHTVVVQDSAGTNYCSAQLTVVDTQPPVLQTHATNLWPPNHKFHEIAVSDCVSAVDACDGDIQGEFIWASSDEPIDDIGRRTLRARRRART